MAAGKPGRPSDYTEELADAICEHIAHGKSLVSWCASEDRPSYTSVMRWLAANEPFREKYARAREAQADYLAEEIVEIASTVLPAVKRTVSGTGKRKRVEEVHGDAVDRARLMVDARKWYASKLAPKKYGERTALTGPDGGPIQIESTLDLSNLPDEQLRALAGIPIPPR